MMVSLLQQFLIILFTFLIKSSTSNPKACTLTYSQYRREQKYPTIDIVNNLNKLTETLGSECLTHLINFKGVNLFSFKIPIVLSRYDVVTRFSARPPRSSSSKTGARPKLANRTNGKQFLVKFEKVQINSSCNFDPSSLVNLDTKHFAKPWVCEVTLYLFPPLKRHSSNNFFVDKSLYKFLIPTVYSKMWRVFSNLQYVEDDFDEINQEIYSLYFVNTRITFEILIIEDSIRQHSTIEEPLIMTKQVDIWYREDYSRRY